MLAHRFILIAMKSLAYQTYINELCNLRKYLLEIPVLRGRLEEETGKGSKKEISRLRARSHPSIERRVNPNDSIKRSSYYLG